MANLELVNTDLSMRCAYCDDCSHLTVECPGLRSASPIAREFKERYGLVLTPRPCSKCGFPEHSGRKLFELHREFDDGNRYVLLCGDCASDGTPLEQQPVKRPEPINWHAWQTPSAEGVGGL